MDDPTEVQTPFPEQEFEEMARSVWLLQSDRDDIRRGLIAWRDLQARFLEERMQAGVKLKKMADDRDRWRQLARDAMFDNSIVAEP